MSEDAGAGTAEGDAGAAAGAEGAEGSAAAQAGAGTGVTPGVADQSAEALLAAAMGSETGADDGAGGDDLAKQLAAARAAEKKWKDTALKTEKRANANAEAAKKLADIEEANKTEAQRLADRATAADQRAAAAELKYHRTLAAATYGLPPGLINSIAGATEDEINESAETLAASINERVAELAAAQSASAGNGASRGTRPVESMRPGAIPASDAAKSTTNPNVAFRQLLTGGQQ